MTAITWEVLADLNNDADYLDAGETVTGDVRTIPGISVSRGLDMQQVLSPPKVSQASYTLDNSQATPTYPIGTIPKGILSRIRASDGAFSTLFEGRVEAAVQHPETGQQSVGIEAIGVMNRLVGKTVSTALLENATADACITALLDAAGFPAADRTLGVGQTTLNYWWLDEEDAWRALVTLVNTEGPNATLYEVGKVLTFENRNYRWETTRSNTSQATFRGTGTEPLHSAPFIYDDGLRNVVNVCKVEIVTRTIAAVAVIWSFAPALSLAASEVKTFIVRTSNADPFKGALDPVAATDYTLVSGAIASATLNRTSGGNATLTITAGAAGATLTGLQVRAEAITVATRTTIQNSVSTTASQTANGLKTYTLSVRPDISAAYALAFCDYVVSLWQSGRPTVTIAVNNGNATRLAQCLDREVSDRITVVEARSGLNQAVWINAINHRFSRGYHVTTFGCEQAQTSPGLWDSGLWDSDSWAL